MRNTSTRKVAWEQPARLSCEPTVSLLIFHGGQTRVEALENTPCVLGRDSSADICLDDDSLSRHHARFEPSADGVLVTDLDSTNGVYVNGAKKKDAFVGPQDDVVMGNVVIAVHVLNPSAPRALMSHDAFVERMSKEANRARHFKKSFAMLMAKLSTEVDTSTMAWLHEAIGPIGELARFSRQTVELFVPELDEGGAERLAKKIASIDRQARVAVGLFPRAGTTAERLLSSCVQALAATRTTERVVVAPALTSVTTEQEAAPLIAQSGPMIDLLEQVERFASAMLPVLLIGETGSGKEVIARELHRRAMHRRDGPLISINCGAIPSTLTESVLFGHQRGAFTGAHAQQLGLFEQADGGTVLLDEVGELSHAAQVALLRVLENAVITRIGSHQEIEIDVRVVAATNRDLSAMCEAGAFREDLFYRLAGTVLRIPPLRERLEEIPELVHCFIERANTVNRRSVESVDTRTMRLLCGYDWPGNIRQLRNVIERAVVLAQTDVITEDLLPASVTAQSSRLEVELDLRSSMRHHERDVIVRALRTARGSRQEAALLLKIPLRTLSRKLSEHGIGKKNKV
jgi:DNA-binding NtrC family response regulator